MRVEGENAELIYNNRLFLLDKGSPHDGVDTGLQYFQADGFSHQVVCPELKYFCYILFGGRVKEEDQSNIHLHGFECISQPDLFFVGGYVQDTQVGAYGAKMIVGFFFPGECLRTVFFGSQAFLE